jgi:hypothetical protein
MTKDDYISQQAKTILKALIDADYNVGKLPHQHAWEITGQDDDQTHLVLTYIPKPVNAWRLLPHGVSPTHQKIYALIDETLGKFRI